MLLITAGERFGEVVLLDLWLIGLICLFRYRKKKVHKLENDIENSKAELEQKIDESIDRMGYHLLVLPPDYRYYMAAEYIYNCFRNDRADTMREAVELYEEQYHRRKMEHAIGQVMEEQKIIEQKVNAALDAANYAAYQASVAVSDNY